MKFEITNLATIEKKVQQAILQKMRRVFKQGDKLMLDYAQVLQKTFLNSKEFKDLGSSLVGEFGFTPEEVANLQRVGDLLVPGNNPVTVSSVKSQGDSFYMQLEWVDFAKLKEHEYARHALTRLDADGHVRSVTDVVSWVEWLEDGVTVRGYYFTRPNEVAAKFSRSGEGLMRKKEGSLWVFEPTRIFERISQLDKGEFLRRGFGILFKKYGK